MIEKRSSGGIDPIGETLSSQFGVTCARSKNREGSSAINGTFIFQRDQDSSRVGRFIKFKVDGTVVDRADELQNQIDELSLVVAQLRRNLEREAANREEEDMRIEGRFQQIEIAKYFGGISDGNKNIDVCLRSGPGKNKVIRTKHMRKCFRIAHDACKAEGFDGGFISGGMTTIKDKASVICVKAGPLGELD